MIVYEPQSAKLLLRVDDIVSARRKLHVSSQVVGIW